MSGIKRIGDVFVAVILLVLCLPVIIIIILLIKLDGTGGDIFADTPSRVGRDGRLFRMFKFRTMVPHAHNILEQDVRIQSKKEQGGGKIRTDDDPRVTAVGRLLRKTDLDELPQLINVIRGDMSLVGPRPYYPTEIDDCIRDVTNGNKLFAAILSVRPGITGLWQVSGRNDVPITDRVKIDARYVNERSVIYDAIILIKTPLVVITRKGAW